ncbi:galactoside-binding lectin [Teladorsagia circumcincta]|uniref:Galectin n=1 Tax=Teladorsagia circumcincta TaxID=45464 RepID=A0A2G9UUE3_TELCI|nr:galactoside-binding lectin [Teladorsagia circumcincta]
MLTVMSMDSTSTDTESINSNSSGHRKITPITPVPFTTEIYNPKTPVEVPVRGFTYGQRLRVVVIPSDKKDKKFHINLKSGHDIVVHFNPRLKDKSLVFNSYYHGGWQTEERASVVFPFEAKEIYTVEFVATGHNSVTVHVNGKHLYEFRERQSGWSVTSIEVGGDVHVHSVHIG